MNLEKARFNMIEQQIRPWSVLDQAVLDTMGNIPRDQFAPRELTSLAYADIEIPLGHGESMMFPRVEGRMLQELAIDMNDECLEIGTGSGYVTACMAALGKSVDTLEIWDDFVQKAKENLSRLNFSNVTFTNADALEYLAAKKFNKQYDAIAVTGSIPEYLPGFEKLLKPGGRLFVVVGSGQTMHAIKVIKEENGGLVRSNLFETELKPLVGVAQKSAFTF